MATPILIDSKAPRVLFPARTPSKLIVNRFQQLPVVGDQYYFDEDLTFLDKKITGIKFHFYGGVFADFFVGPHYQVNQDRYNVCFYGEMRKTLITLIDKDNNMLLEDQPVATLLANYGSIANVVQQKYTRRFDLNNVSFKASYLRFTDLPTTPLPFVIPFTFFYK